MLKAALSGSSVSVYLRYLAYDDDVHSPYVENLSPASGATLVSVTGSVVMRIKDYRNNAGIEIGSGVSLRSIQITIDDGILPVLYNSGSLAFTASGVYFHRTVTITASGSFPYSSQINVSVDAEDLHVPPNVMSTFRYSFMTRSAPAASSSSSSSAASTGEQTSSARRGGNPGNVSPGTHLIPLLQGSSSPRGLHPSPVSERDYTFEDVPDGVWYEGALISLVKRGIINGKARLFRPADYTARAELAKMLVVARNVTPPAVSVSVFADVNPSMWYGPFVEAAAWKGWMKGYGDCMGISFCFTHPTRTITRAEAAAMIVRAYDLTSRANAPEFSDVPADAWFASGIDAAAAHCIMQGDDGTGLARPADPVTRAEIVMMLGRAEQKLVYGKECGN